MAFCQSEQLGRHLVLQRNKTLLNGRVTENKDSEITDGAVGGTDIKYEYTYSMNDKEGEDGFQYSFNAYPVLKHGNEFILPTGSSGKNYSCVNDCGNETCWKLPCSKGHVSFCDISDIVNQVSSRPSLTRSGTSPDTGLTRPRLTRATTESGEIKRRKTPVCSIQERPTLTIQDDASRKRKPESEHGKYPITTYKVPWKERLKLAIKREVDRSHSARKSQDICNRRKSISYDPDLEKSTAYIHGGDKNFSRAKTSLTPVRSGLKQLQMNYTETNLEDNQSLVFLDLLKSSHRQNRLRGINIRNIESRLEAKRDSPYFSTSFFENKNIPDPFRKQEKKCARTMVQKQYERQEKIRRTTDELHIGYKRTFLTLKTVSREEVEQLGNKFTEVMEEFLQERGIQKDVVKRMKDDGIDEHVIAVMTVEQLSDYLPRYGDCLAAIAFCKQNIVSSQQKVKGPCSSLRERLILKLQGKRIGQEHSRRSAPQKGNMNAKKSSKKIEIGWLHQYGPNDIKQVRSSSGGGTRHVQVDLDCPISHVLDVAKDLFFPNGLSKKGSVENFHFSITDQIQEIIPNEKTVGEYIESTKHKTVRMYILSSRQEKLNKPQEKSEVDNPPHSTEIFNTNHQQPTLLESEPFEPVSSLNSQEDALCSEILDTNVFSNNDLEPHSFPSADHDLSTQNEVLYSHSEEEVALLDLPNSTEFHLNETFVIRIHRSNILNEMIQVFKDHIILTRSLQFIFVDELGRDAKGVSRDVYAGFWEAFLLKFTDGEDFRIPVLSNNLGDTEWESIGRILLKGYEDHKYFPVTVAPAFSVALCHGETAVSTDILKKSFMSYLSVTDREIIESSLHRETEDNDDLLELLDRFECHSIPTQENLMLLILQIAHRVIIQEPKYVLDSLQRVGKHFWSKEFATVDSILVMYEKLEPTVQKVLALFKANPLTKEQNDAFKYLQKFVRGRNKTQLRYLLRFLTGSDMLCVEAIEIIFVVRHGVGRVPTAHTCGPVLELPSTYINFPDFRNEWESILQGKENMHMTLA